MKLSPSLLILLTIYQGSPVQSTCNECIVSKIKDYWKDNGVPKDILKTNTKIKAFRFNYVTDEAAGGEVKCVISHHDYVKGLATATFHYVNGCSSTVEYKVTEKDGILHQTEGDKKYDEHVLLNKNGVIAFYKCPLGTTKDSNIVIIASDISREEDCVTQDTLKEAVNQFTNYGIKDLRKLPACPDKVPE